MKEGPPDRSAVLDVASRLLPGLTSSDIERVPEGVSTFVYRIRYRGQILFLRILPETGASFAPETLVHRELRRMGVSVPEILYVEDDNPRIQRSIMLTSGIPGSSLAVSNPDQSMHQVLEQAGRDLAIINSLPVDGFGWIRRDESGHGRLVGEHRGFQSFALGDIDRQLAMLRSAGLDHETIAAIERIVSTLGEWLNTSSAILAHGDFDVTHIFAEDGRYTGIIDFGEIRGAHQLYDLGHFRMHDGETLSLEVLPSLVNGYRQICPLHSNDERYIYISSLLIGLKTTARYAERFGDITGHWGLRAIIRDISALHAG